MRPGLSLPILVLCAIGARQSFADSEAPNRPHLTAGEFGQCYVKSVPIDAWGERGETRLFAVTSGADELLATYDWFSQQIHLRCNTLRDGNRGATVVRMGPWPRGHEARTEDFALALYFNEQLLARYSTIDIAGKPCNVDASVSHYMVIRNVIGFRVSANGSPERYEFAIETVRGEEIAFDTLTGRRN